VLEFFYTEMMLGLPISLLFKFDIRVVEAMLLNTDDCNFRLKSRNNKFRELVYVL